MKSNSLTSIITFVLLLDIVLLVHGLKLDSNQQYNNDLSADTDERLALLRSLLTGTNSRSQGIDAMDVRQRRVGSMGWGPGGSPMSAATGLYIMCIERSRSMGANAGQCSTFLAAKKWDRM